jgi:hypothetical protein
LLLGIRSFSTSGRSRSRRGRVFDVDGTSVRVGTGLGVRRQDSELERNAREILAADFDLIVWAYGFDPDVEEVIASRDR